MLLFLQRLGEGDAVRVEVQKVVLDVVGPVHGKVCTYNSNTNLNCSVVELKIWQLGLLSFHSIPGGPTAGRGRGGL